MVASEALEAFGGAGYIEDTGLPQLLRDAQVLPIWEGTTNVLSLDTLRAMAKEPTFAALGEEISARLARATAPELRFAVETARKAQEHAAAWVAQALEQPAQLEANARRFALTLGRTLELALLCDHAQWALSQGKGKRAAAAAERLALNGVDLIFSRGAELTGALQ